MNLNLAEYLPILIPLALLQVGLAIFAVVDVVKHPHYKFGNQLLWILVCVFVSWLGPIIYFAFGKGEAE